MESRRVKYTAHNILEYYFAFSQEIDTTLINFVNEDDCALTIKYESMVNEYGENETSTFFENLIQCNELLDERYDMMLKNFNRVYNNFSFKEIDDSKIDILIDKKIISIKRENYCRKIISFLTSNIEEYIKAIDDDIFSKEELFHILPNELIDDRFKIELLEKTSEVISVKEKVYTEISLCKKCSHKNCENTKRAN